MASSDDPRREADGRLGRNLRAARERADMSQDELAAAMREAGWAEWRQSTVHKAEHALRKVSLFEAEQLAAILSVTIDRLLWLQGEDAVVATTEDAISRLRQAWQDVSDAALRLAGARAVGERALVDAKASKYSRARDTAAFLEAEIESQTPEAALSDGLARFGDGRG